MDCLNRLIIVLGLLWVSVMGAHAQSATTQTATGVNDITATLSGSVNPGSSSMYRYVKFEYWTEGPILTVNGNPYDVIGTLPVSVTASPPGLLPNTTYHYRVVLSPSQFGGGWMGEEMSFTTGPPVTLPALQSAYANIIGDTQVNFVIWNTTSGGSPATTTFEYGPTASYGTKVSMAETMATNTTRSFAQINATGLTPGTLYHYRVKVSNAQGTTTSADATFTTTLPATVTTGAATGVTRFSANVSGSATPLAHTLQMIFEYGTSTSYGATVNATPSQVSGSGTTDVSAALTGLLPGATYHYRLRGADGGFYDGTDMTFTTPSNVTTLPATTVIDLGATANGTVLTDGSGGIFSHVFEYGTTTAYGQTRSATQVQSDAQNTDLKIISASLSQLLPNTGYHYRLRSTRNSHTTYGEDVTFTTGPAATPPVLGVPSQSLSTRYTTAANLAVSVQAGSSETTVVFDYGSDTSYGSQAVPTGSFPLNSSSVAGVTVTGLAPATTYHFRVRATNSEGTTTSVDATFTTLPAPDVTTNAATNVGATWATLNGTYHMHERYYDVTFEYGTSTAYGFTIAPPFVVMYFVNGVVIGNNSVQNSSTIPANLAINTTYHYRLKLTDNLGVSYYGADSTFTTVTSVEAWRQNYFSTSSNSGEAADLATPANDNMPNLLKYALGLVPHKPATLSAATISGDPGTERLIFSFSRLLAATDVTYEVQAADNPAGPWTTIATAAGGGAFSGPAQVNQTGTFLNFPGFPNTGYPTTTATFAVRDTVPVSSAPRRFMRLRVTR